MKGVGYGMTLAVILLSTNFALWAVGFDIPLVTWLGTGVQTRTSPTDILPNSTETVGNFTTGAGGIETFGWQILLAGLIGAVGGIIANILTGGRVSLTYFIPMAMVASLVLFLITPMGLIIGSNIDLENGQVCYQISENRGMYRMYVSAGRPPILCLQTELHVLLVLLFGLLFVGMIMSFTRGYEW